MSFIILNSNYEIKEFTKESNDINEFVKHIKSMKEIICKRKCKKSGEEFNLTTNFILKEVAELKKDDSRFAFAIYQSVLLYGKQTKRPTVILFARKSSKNNIYILSLLCKYEGTQKGFGSLLLNKLIEKGNQNNIGYIYVESTYNAKTFYKQHDFDTESDKEQFTDSEQQIECYGYLLDITKKNNNIIVGGTKNWFFNAKDLQHKIYTYKYNDNILQLYDNDILLGKIKLVTKMHPQYCYISLIIDDYSDSDMELNKLLFNILDCLSLEKYIYKTEIFINPNNKELIKLFEELNYEHKKNKIENMLYYFEKIHNQPHIIDRTVLSYDYN
jgi:hypothetical protein